jgi:hypothetical protein
MTAEPFAGTRNGTVMVSPGARNEGTLAICAVGASKCVGV